MLKIITTLGILCSITVMSSSYSKIQSSRKSQSNELETVKAACLDYVEGWFDSNTERVSYGVHPDLVKRIPKPDEPEPNRLD